jgi:hypothetical protein
MPVTIKPAPHGANPYPDSPYRPKAADATELFKSACCNESEKMKEVRIIQSSFEKLCSEDSVFGSVNGIAPPSFHQPS